MEEKKELTITIGGVAKLAGVGVETVRFYERRGLIEQPPKKDSGYRHYPYAVVRRIKFVRHAKELGFSLKEILELLALKVDPSSTCADIRNRSERKIEDIGEKIKSLEKMQKTLKKLAKSCIGEGSADECPILEALDQEEL